MGHKGIKLVIWGGETI